MPDTPHTARSATNTHTRPTIRMHTRSAAHDPAGPRGASTSSGGTPSAVPPAMVTTSPASFTHGRQGARRGE